MAVQLHDKKFIRRYKAWLKDHGLLFDCAYGSEQDGWNQFNDFELSQLRNFPKLRYVEREIDGYRFPVRTYRGDFSPKYDDFNSHLDRDFPFNIFAYNRSSSDGVILMLADIDNKLGHGDVERATSHLVVTYGFADAFVEPSTHYLGRHVYFKLNVELTGVTHWAGRQDIWDTFDRLTTHIKADAIWKETGITFDGFFGLPTIWRKDEYGAHKVSQRGNALKLPRCLMGHADLDKLDSLVPMSFEKLYAAIFCSKTDVIPRTASGVVDVSNDTVAAKVKVLDLDAMDGFDKKKHCISRLLIRTDGNVSAEEVYDEYMSNWNPTSENDSPSDAQERHKVISGMLRNMTKRFRPKSDRRLHPFERDEFSPIIRDLKIPEDDFKWDRREKIDVQRLSDFVSMKIADAYYKNKEGWFAMTCRDTSVQNSRLLKEAGKIDWTLNNSTYKKLLDIAVKYDLLRIEKEFKKPIIDLSTKRKLVKGTARLIGPGKALASVRNEWLPLYNQWKAQSPVMAFVA